MQYFRDFKTLLYRFGNEFDPVAFQDISKYGDVIDQIKDNVTFFNFHTIQEGLRPDQVSIQLYQTPLYYWTFYLLNDDIREQGWPLTNGELQSYTQKIFPNTIINTRENISAKFKVGQTVTGGSSGASGTIIRRNLNLGQIVVEGIQGFRTSGELFQSTNTAGVVESLTAFSTAKEYLAASHYIDGNQKIVDIDPFSAPGATLTEKTNEDVYYDINESLKTIKIIKPSLMGTLISSYRKTIRE